MATPYSNRMKILCRYNIVLLTIQVSFLSNKLNTSTPGRRRDDIPIHDTNFKYTPVVSMRLQALWFRPRIDIKLFRNFMIFLHNTHVYREPTIQIYLTATEIEFLIASLKQNYIVT